jgi:hypothetical protein
MTRHAPDAGKTAQAGVHEIDIAPDLAVMAGLGPATHDFSAGAVRMWVSHGCPGQAWPSPGMTHERSVSWPTGPGDGDGMCRS